MFTNSPMCTETNLGWGMSGVLLVPEVEGPRQANLPALLEEDDLRAILEETTFLNAVSCIDDLVYSITWDKTE